MNKNKAFSLIEMLVAVTVFTLIMGSAAGLFIAGIRSQAKALVFNKLIDETGFVMEKMSRALRMAKKDLSASCTQSCPGCNYAPLPSLGDSTISFINSQDECMAFYGGSFVGPLLYQDPGFNELISTDFEVTSVVFDLSGESQSEIPNLQPRVTILLKIKNANAAKPEMTIQTTISQRNLDVQQ
ncbi:prepilin-type N-terminal cleavage/methylation domain-containing protein [Patescibacteria group bacterium]|nr:prepilin-type N-terminal cleavage/methylation domain-containing protein [Patescibacteria group bacterium]